MIEEKDLNRQSMTDFVQRKCKRDHLKQSYDNSSHFRTGSLYGRDYRSSKSKQGRDSTYMIGKETNSPVKRDSNYVTPIDSVYRCSFQNHEVSKPSRAKQKQSFFLKNENVEPPSSTYNRMSVLGKLGEQLAYTKAKPRCDNLGVPKYNRMNSNSVYKMEFEAPLKLPAIQNQNQSKGGRHVAASEHLRK